MSVKHLSNKRRGIVTGEGGDGNASGTTSTAATPASVDDLAQRKKVVITNLSSTFTSFHAQEVADGPKIEEMLTRLREEAKNNPPLPDYQPKRGELAMARFFEDGLWYRAKVEKLIGPNEAQVLYTLIMIIVR